MNSDYLDCGAGPHVDLQWRALKNIPAATVACYNATGHIFVSTLNAPTEDAGCLWCLNEDGHVLWHTGTRVRASLTSPAVTQAGSVVVADGAHLFHWAVSGELLWQVPFAHETAGVMIAPQGQIVVLGIDGCLAVFDAGQGTQLHALRLESVPMAQGVWHSHMRGRAGEGMRARLQQRGVDASYVDTGIRRFLGIGVAAKNVPALHPHSGRIFIAAAGETADSGILYGIDLLNLERAFKVSMGPGCDTSPALSFDLSQVFCADQGGCITSHATDDGRVLWSTPLPGTSSASPNPTPDGRLYISIKSDVVCLSATGEVLWTSELKKQTGADVQINSVLCVNRQFIYCVAALGQASADRGFVPAAHALLSLDRLTGQIVSRTALAHESVCTLSMWPDGSVLVPSKPFLYEARDPEFFGLAKYRVRPGGALS
ncbi:PQQ-binding-like beta-propeller repeat protein [Caenimonas sp. SL110]|uniref:outer membrane protein assembly factor BamB family protein n=1 Tax=Caenimonas sp. SL110 TaxID=1450524 RepID=UPI001379319F|nr:PQQ-binding-like beta-propeller repeat protein [Caenimonas sp. SL110]